MLVKGSNSISFPMEQEVTTNRSLCFARQGSVEVKTDLGGGKIPTFVKKSDKIESGSSQKVSQVCSIS